MREGYAKQTMEIMMGILNKALRHAVHPYKNINESPTSICQVNDGYA